MRSSLSALAVLAALAAVAGAAGAAGPEPGAVPVLLSFDVEHDGDLEPLAEIRRLGVSATYFFLGPFVEQHPELVAELAAGNTVGSHAWSHTDLTTLEPEAARRELERTSAALERATGRPPRWLRAPYGAWDDRVLAAAAEVGLRYDSSQWSRWQRPGPLPVLPVSYGAGGLLASDWDLVAEAGMSHAELLTWLKDSYRERTATGRPFVVLCHPAILAPQIAALADFVTFVEGAGGAFLSFDQYLDDAAARRPERRGVWIDWSLERRGWGRHDPRRIAADAERAGLTDVFLLVRDRRGRAYARPRRGAGDRFGTTLALLKQAGIRVHAWIPALRDAAAARRRPRRAMAADDGARSREWLSPTHPAVRERLLAEVAEILDRYDVDGIHLGDLRYPDLDHDFAPEAVAAFARDAGLELDPELPRQLLNRHYQPWTDWRAERIAATAAAVRDAVRRLAGPRIAVSASLDAEAAISHLARDGSGQDFALLAERLDFLVPLAGHKTGRQPPGWIADVLFAARHRAGRTPLWLGVETYRQPTAWDYTTAELAAVARAAAAGADGLVAYPYLTLFGRGKPRRNLPPGSGELFARAGRPRPSPISEGVP